jgi:sulfoquinovosidase
MGVRLLPFLLAASLSSPLLACSEAETLSPAPFPLDVGGDISLTLESQRLVISSADGRVLLDGLAPAPIADGAPPLAGFAVADVTTTYEMQFGTFMPTVTANGRWRVAEQLLPADGGGLELRDGAGAILATMTFTMPEAGHLVASIAPGPGPERHFTWGFACDDGDHFSGFGAQSLDVDHRGFTVPAWLQEQGIGKRMDDTYPAIWFIVGTRHASYVPIPQYLSRRGYMLTAETPLRPLFALCSESPTAARVELDLPANVHIFDGPTPAEAIARSTTTFGRPRMPPPVAFAPWLDAIFGDANVRAVAQKLRQAGIPTSVIWTEDWRGGSFDGDNYTLDEEWDVDTTLYPDMPGMTDELHGEGFDFFVYFNPFVYQSSAAWPETAPYGWLVQQTDGTPYTFPGAKGALPTGLIDLDNPEARAWAVQKMQNAIALGADGWMNDFAEWLPTDGMTAAGPSLLRHTAYPVLWQQTAREAVDGVNDGTERLFFSRSGWLGSAPLIDVMWAGDQRTDFEPDDGLPTVLPIGIGMGIAGISTYGHDIAGYQSATNPTSTKELFFRWTEVGAWSPVMRTHHGTEPLLEWSWQSDAETTAHFARYAKQHMALVPYLQGLAQVASQTGMPMWRGLMLAYPADATAWGIKDEVLLGDGVLVAPVMTMGATDRTVYLPAGRWYPWAGGPALAGATSVDAPAAVTEIPVFAAAGTVVPSFPDGVMTLVRGSAAVPDASLVGDSRIVYAFLGADGAFTETGGLAYTLASQPAATGTLAASWNGQALAACDTANTAPCVATTADGLTAHVTGPGTLGISSGGAAAATLSAQGGSPARAVTWVVRR